MIPHRRAMQLFDTAMRVGRLTQSGSWQIALSSKAPVVSSKQDSNWSKQDEHLLHHRRSGRNNCSRWLFRTARLNEGDLRRPVLTFLKTVTIPVADDIAWPAKVALEG